MPEILGIDFGGVICDRVGADGKIVAEFDDEEVFKIEPVAGVHDSIASLVSRKFGPKNTFLISSALRIKTEINTRRWLMFQHFYELTYLPQEHVLICRKRQEKAEICREVGITHFIDDRPQVLQTLIGVVPHLYWFQPRNQDLEEFPNLRQPFVTICYSWPHVVDAILADWNDYHEGSFTTEIVGRVPYGIVCRDETLISATVKAYQCAFGHQLSPIEILHLPDQLTIADYSTELNVLRVKVCEA